MARHGASAGKLGKGPDRANDGRKQGERRRASPKCQALFSPQGQSSETPMPRAVMAFLAESHSRCEKTAVRIRTPSSND